MRVLKNTLSDPPCGWRYVVPDTGFRVSGCHTFAVLLAKVRDHYLVNDLDVPTDLPVLIQSQIAEHVPERMTKEADT